MNERDPRNKPGHRERGPKRFSYTYADIAKAAGITGASVRNAVSQDRLDPTNLEEVTAFITMTKFRLYKQRTR